MVLTELFYNQANEVGSRQQHTGGYSGLCSIIHKNLLVEVQPDIM